jgi:hypothetical protein
MATRKLTRKDLAEAAEKYKNWGRWGPEDEIGTLNHTSPADRSAGSRIPRRRWSAAVFSETIVAETAMRAE